MIYESYVYVLPYIVCNSKRLTWGSAPSSNLSTIVTRYAKCRHSIWYSLALEIPVAVFFTNSFQSIFTSGTWATSWSNASTVVAGYLQNHRSTQSKSRQMLTKFETIHINCFELSQNSQILWINGVESLSICLYAVYIRPTTFIKPKSYEGHKISRLELCRYT